MGRVKQALEPGVAAQGGPRFAFQDSQSILFAGQLLLKGREVAGNPFLLGFLMAAGLQQLALDFVDLPPFVAFDALEVLFPGGGLGAEHSGFALREAGSWSQCVVKNYEGYSQSLLIFRRTLSRLAMPVIAEFTVDSSSSR